jgi:hypothetical protein
LIILACKKGIQEGTFIMNEDARKHVEHAITNLKEVKNCLGKASSNAENGTIREKISSQLSSIESCLDECEAISSGLSNLGQK